MVYVDAFVIVIPKNKIKEYTKMAKGGCKIWMKHGALSYIESVGEDLYPKMGEAKQQGFPKLTKMKKNETVVFSFITYKSKKHRDQVNKKVMSDPGMNELGESMKEMPFSMSRFSYGGFTSIATN